MLTSAGLIEGCQTPQEQENEPRGDKSVRVVCNEWHCELILDLDYFDSESIVRKTRFSSSGYLQIGWGDRDFYMSRTPGVWYALKAALWPTDGVLHLRMHHGDEHQLSRHFRYHNVAVVRIREDQLNEMISYIEESFAKDPDGNPVYLDRGWWTNSAFYLSSRDYYLPHTCNYWTARALSRSGLNLTPLLYQRSSSLYHEAKSIEQKQQKR